MHIVDIPTSMSVKWESDPEFPLSHISSATHTASNKFELYTECHWDRWGVCGVMERFCNEWESWKVRVKEE